MVKSKTRKPGPLRTRNIFAVCHIDNGKVRVEISDRGAWSELGSPIPSDKELEKLTNWIRKVRSFRNNRNSKG